MIYGTVSDEVLCNDSVIELLKLELHELDIAIDLVDSLAWPVLREVRVFFDLVQGLLGDPNWVRLRSGIR